MYSRTIATKGVVELGATTLIALLFVRVYNSSPVSIALGVLALTLILPLAIKYKEYGIFIFVSILPFKYLNVKFVSIIGTNRLFIWGLLSYVIIKQFFMKQEDSVPPSRNFSLFRKATAFFMLSIAISSLLTASEIYSSTYITREMVKKTILADGLVAVEAILLVYIIYYLFDALPKIRRLFTIQSIVGTIIACFGIIQYSLAGPPKIAAFLFDPEYKFYGRATSVFSNPNLFGQFLAPIVGMLIAYFFFGQMSKKQRMLCLLILLLSTLGLVLSFSRAAAVQVLFSITLSTIIYVVKVRRMQLSWKIVLMLIAVSASLFIATQYYEFFLRVRAISCGAQDYQTAIFRINEYNNSQRKQAAIKAFETFLEYPLIGIGHNLFRAKGKAGLEYLGLMSHNQFLEILAEMGLFGFIPLLLMFGLVIRAGLSIWNKNRPQPASEQMQITMLLFLTGFCTATFGYLFSDSLSLIPITGYLWIFSGVIFTLERLDVAATR